MFRTSETISFHGVLHGIWNSIEGLTGAFKFHENKMANDLSPLQDNFKHPLKL